MPESELDSFNNYNVKLVSVASLRYADPSSLEWIVFTVTPTFSENKTVEYTSVAPIHMPGSMQVYKNTNARQFSIGAKLISRTSADATNNMETLQRLRGWTMPYFGSKSSTLSDAQRNERRSESARRATGSPSPALNQESGTTDAERQAALKIRQAKYGVDLLGAPPDVLYLYAYSKPTSRIGDSKVNINRVPVVITSLEITYPDDVDYIPTSYMGMDPMPTRMDVAISLVETHSPREYEQFDLAAYKAGILPHF